MSGLYTPDVRRFQPAVEPLFTCYALYGNRHMVRGYQYGLIHILENQDGKPRFGHESVSGVDDWENKWFCHTNANIDVAVLPIDGLSVTAPAFFRPLPGKMAINLKEENELQGIEDIIFVGYPIGLYDTNNILPICRHGYTASPVPLNFQGLPCFAIDASVFPGSSGSPVFIYSHGGYPSNGSYELQPRIRLGGIIADSIYHLSETGITLSQTASTLSGSFTNSQPINIGLVFKAETIKETIDQYIAMEKSKIASPPQTK